MNKKFLEKLRQRRDHQEIYYYLVRARFNDNQKEEQQLGALWNELFNPEKEEEEQRLNEEANAYEVSFQ